MYIVFLLENCIKGFTICCYLFPGISCHVLLKPQIKEMLRLSLIVSDSTLMTSMENIGQLWHHSITFCSVFCLTV